MQTQQWFVERIGKRIFRDKNNPPCGCHTCNEIEKNGMIITDENHAQYLFDIQNEFADGGHYLNYRDNK